MIEAVFGLARAHTATPSDQTTSSPTMAKAASSWQGSDSLHNTITQNSIHDNGGRGIALWDGGNDQLPVPVILDFDLSAGIMTGATCSHCTVEIFSDSSDEGAIYEGRTTADDTGVFTFDKGTVFYRPLT